MLKNRKLDHFGFGTDNLEETVNWYINELGFKLVSECVMDDGTQIKYLKGRDFTYEIYQPAVGVDPKTAGKIDHVAFVSENLEGDYKECMKRGYKDTTGGIQAIPGVRYFKFLNVTGEEVEFCQAI